MKRWCSALGALILSLACCNSSYGFEWLDRLIGIDLDNSEAKEAAPPMQGYQPYTAGYSPYAAGYAPYTAGYAPSTTAGYAPYTAGYPAPAAPGCASCAPACATCAPRCCAPQTCYRTVYMPVAVTTYQPVVSCDPCGRRVTTMRPVVAYRMQAQVVPYGAGP